MGREAQGRVDGDGVDSSGAQETGGVTTPGTDRGHGGAGSSARLADALYRAHAPAVLGYLRGLGIPDAEDVTGEVFVSVVRDLHRFRGDDAGLRRWLFTIAHHRAVDAVRKRTRRREEAVDPTELRSAPVAADDPAEQVTARLSALPAFLALDRLTLDQRSVVLLRLVADLSVAETAEILGKEPGAVKTLQRRALAALHRAVTLEAVS
jgi:RNA polymerase sigma-70 factor (ECF subfamily)